MESQANTVKIAASPQEHTWAQAYSTLKLYIVLGIEDKNAKTVASTGKEILERLQREFFAQDEKTLDSIKKATQNVTTSLDQGIDLSLALATIVGDLLYIVVSGSGIVAIQRQEKIGIVAQSKSGELAAFSGKLVGGDSIALSTGEFLDKVPLEKLSEVLSKNDLVNATESIAPLIHSDSTGKEAALLVLYQAPPTQTSVPSPEQTLEDQIIEEEQEQLMGRSSALSIIPNIKLPSVSNLNLNNIFSSKKKLLITAVLILIIILAGSLIFDRLNADGRKREQTLNEILKPLDEKYQNAIAIQSLNSSLALDDLIQIQDEINKQQSKLPEGTREREKLDEFSKMVSAKIEEMGGGGEGTSLKVFFDPSKDSSLSNVTALTHKGTVLVASSKDGDIALLKDNGSVEKTTGGKASNIKSITANEKDVFLLGDSLYRVSKSGGDAEEIVEDTQNIISIDGFGANVYGLLAHSINKFSGSAYSKSSYMSGDSKLEDSASSFSIDSSIWTISKEGKIQKFTRGQEDSFEIKNLSKPFGNSPKIYTDEEYTNIYILDPQNSRVVAISKTGEVGRQYKAKEFAKAKDIAVYEQGKRLYILSGGKIYSQDL